MIQITISEKDNPKVAGWLMDNNIEYSSVPVQEGKSKEEIIKARYPFYDENLSIKDVELNGEQVQTLMEEYANQFKQPVPVSVGYSYEQMMDVAGWMAAADCTRPIHELKEEAEVYISKLTPTEQQDKGDGLVTVNKYLSL